MKRWVIIAFVGLVVVLGVGFGLTLIPKLRQNAADAGCKNNFREVGLFAAHNADPHADRTKVSNQIPAGTVVNTALPPDERVSWYVTILPGFDQKRQDMTPVLTGIDRGQPWSAERNQTAARTKLVALLCPGNPPDVSPDQPAPSCYVGIAGFGKDAATIPAPKDPLQPFDPRAGCFRYDAPTPFVMITDGLSQTLLIGERSNNLGSWIRGGPATVRGLDNTPGAAVIQGVGGQFGGNHPNGSNWGFADGSVRFFTDRTDPKVLLAMATIAGRDNDQLPGE